MLQVAPQPVTHLHAMVQQWHQDSTHALRTLHPHTAPYIETHRQLGGHPTACNLYPGPQLATSARRMAPHQPNIRGGLTSRAQTITAQCLHVPPPPPQSPALSVQASPEARTPPLCVCAPHHRGVATAPRCTSPAISASICGNVIYANSMRPCALLRQHTCACRYLS